MSGRSRPQLLIVVGLLASVLSLAFGGHAYRGLAVPMPDPVGPAITLSLAVAGAATALVAAARSPDLSYRWMSLLMVTLVLSVFGALLALVLLVAQIG